MTANAGYHAYATGDVLTAAQVQFNLQNQTLMYFATAGARTTALSGVLVEGMITYIPANGVEYYNGSVWIALAAGDAAPAGTLTGTTLASNVVNSSLTSFGTAPTLASVTNGGTVTIPSGADTLVARTSTDTMTNKTLTSPVINSPKISSSYTSKTASYTFVSGDEGNLFSMNNAATQQFNIPTDATFNFAVGTEINVFWITGAGQPTIGAVTPATTTVISTGATSATPKLRVANSGATCKKLAANSWIIFGDLS